MTQLGDNRPFISLHGFTTTSKFGNLSNMTSAYALDFGGITDIYNSGVIELSQVQEKNNLFC